MLASGRTSENWTRLTEDGPLAGYSVAAIDSIRRLAVSGFTAFSHGGLETGGVLYGSREGHRVSVVSFAELECEHALGPSFILSETDRAALAALLLQPPDGLEAVGWYRIHTRSGLELDFHDRRFFDTFPSGKTCAALIVKPTAWGPAAAAFFVREPDGQIFPPAPREFLIEPWKGAGESPLSNTKQQDEQRRIAQPPVEQAADEQAIETLEPAYLPAVSEVPRHANPWVRPAWILCAVSLCMLAAFLLWPRPSRNLDLVVYAIAPGQVRIEWNRRSLPILQARSATLTIDDGNLSEKIPLEREQLRSTSVTYGQLSGHISVRLHVIGQDASAPPVEEATQFIGQPAPPTPPDPALAIPEAPLAAAATQEQPARAPLRAASGTRGSERRASPVPVPNEAPPQPIAKRFQITRVAPVEAPLVSTLPVPPVLSTRPSQVALPDFLSAPPPHSQPFIPQPSAPPYAGPRSGRLIWTGVLGRRGVVDIEGNHVDIGSLAGGFPGVPVSVRVSPAEFGRDGLMVFTVDAARAGVREPPGRSNGWNAVQFQIDPERARGIVVLESPNRTNDFKRLVLRSGLRNCPVIVIDWSLIQP
jgi:hypothetical protein